MARKSHIDGALIEQYINITGADGTVAKNMLEAFDGNLEVAVNMYLEGRVDTVSSPSTSLSNQSSSFSVKNERAMEKSSEDVIRAPIPQQKAILVEDQYHALPYNPRRQQTSRSVFDGCRDFQKESEEREQSLRSKRQGSKGRYSKKKHLHELFKPPVDILHTGDFQSARKVSEMKNKWLLVNIQNTIEFSCQVLNRDVWSNKIVREIIAESFILWQVCHDSDEGQHYATFYKILNYPHLAIIDPRTGERLVMWEKLGMKPSANQFAELATLFLSDHPKLNHSMEKEAENKSSRKPSIIDSSEDAQLQAAIKASLEPYLIDDSGDKISENSDDSDIGILHIKKRRKTDSPVPVPSNQHNNFTDQHNNSIDHSPIKKISLDSKEATVTNDNTSSIKKQTSDSLSESSKEKATIILRLPDNGRKIICVPMTDTLKELAFEVSKLGYPTDRYELVKAFPRQNISQLDQQMSLIKAGLHRQETLFIQDR